MTTLEQLRSLEKTLEGLEYTLPSLGETEAAFLDLTEYLSMAQRQVTELIIDLEVEAVRKEARELQEAGA